MPTKLTSRSTTIDISKHAFALGGLSMFNRCDMMINTPCNFFATNSNESFAYFIMKAKMSVVHHNDFELYT